MGAVRMCIVFYCDAIGKRICCRDCSGYDVCKNRCLNHPDRCRLSEPGRKYGKEAAQRRQPETKNS